MEDNDDIRLKTSRKIPDNMGAIVRSTDCFCDDKTGAGFIYFNTFASSSITFAISIGFDR